MSIFRSFFLYTGCLVLHVVFSTKCCGCGPTEPVCSLVHCVWVSIQQTHTQCTRLHTGSVGPQPQHLVLNTTCSSKQPVYKKNSWRWTYRCPKHVEATYDNKSQLLHQVGTSRHFHTVTHTSNIQCSIRDEISLVAWPLTNVRRS